MERSSFSQLQGASAKTPPGVASQLSLTDLPMTEVSCLSSHFDHIYPSFSIESGNPIELLISPSNYYTDLSNIWISITGKIANKKGENIEATTCAPTNNFLHSLFQSMEVSIGNTSLSRNSNFYPYIAYLTRLLGCSEGTRSTLGALELLTNDGDNPDDRTTTNIGYTYRKNISLNSKTFSMLGKICHGLLSCNKFLIPNVPLRIVLRRSTDEFNIDSETLATNTKFDAAFKIEKCQLYVRRVAVSPQVQNAHEALLNRNQPIRYGYLDNSIVSYSLAKGTISNISEALSVGPLPARCIIGFVESDSFFGKAEKSPFFFKPNDIESCVLTIDNEEVLLKKVEIDTTTRNFLIAYIQSQLYTHDGNGISPENFGKSNFLMVYDIIPTSRNNNFGINREGILRFDVKFRTKLADPINVVCLLQHQTILSLSKQGATLEVV